MNRHNETRTEHDILLSAHVSYVRALALTRDPNERAKLEAAIRDVCAKRKVPVQYSFTTGIPSTHKKQLDKVTLNTECECGHTLHSHYSSAVGPRCLRCNCTTGFKAAPTNEIPL